MMRSIGSAYRISNVKQSTKGGKMATKGNMQGDANWARAAIAISARARHRGFQLSQPGPARQIPDILLQGSAVAVASARRLSRSSARMGVDSLRELAALALRACEGYVLTKAEKRQLQRAAELEAEVEEADRVAEEDKMHEIDKPASTESALALAIKAAEEEAERKARIEQARLEAQGLAPPAQPAEGEAASASPVPAKPAAATAATAEAIKEEMAVMEWEEQDRLAREREEQAAQSDQPVAEAAAQADKLPTDAELPDVSDGTARAASVAAPAAVSGEPDASAAPATPATPAAAPSTKSPARPASPRSGGKAKAASPGKSPGKSPARPASPRSGGKAKPASDAKQTAASPSAKKPASPRGGGKSKA